MTRILKVHPQHPESAALAAAAAVLRQGGLVAFPTETVYGLGADATNAQAVGRIYAAKGRPANNPLIVHVSDPAMARRFVSRWPEAAERLAAAFWPGPLTLVLPKSALVPPAVTAGLDCVGVRMPAHPVALALIEACGLPIAAPSANPYMGVSPTQASHVAAGLDGRVELILDGGSADVGVESTVIDLCGAVPTVLRPGGISLARLRAVLGRVEVLADAPDDEAPLPSPGLAKRHYAPRAPLTLVADEQELHARLAARAAAPEALGVLSAAPLNTPVPGLTLKVLGTTPEAFASRLYASLHELDDAGVAAIYALAVPADDEWAAVRDRLGRAATALSEEP